MALSTALFTRFSKYIFLKATPSQLLVKGGAIASRMALINGLSAFLRLLVDSRASLTVSDAGRMIRS